MDPSPTCEPGEDPRGERNSSDFATSCRRVVYGSFGSEDRTDLPGKVMRGGNGSDSEAATKGRKKEKVGISSYPEFTD